MTSQKVIDSFCKSKSSMPSIDRRPESPSLPNQKSGLKKESESDQNQSFCRQANRYTRPVQRNKQNNNMCKKSASLRFHSRQPLSHVNRIRNQNAKRPKHSSRLFVHANNQPPCSMKPICSGPHKSYVYNDRRGMSSARATPAPRLHHASAAVWYCCPAWPWLHHPDCSAGSWG